MKVLKRITDGELEECLVLIQTELNNRYKNKELTKGNFCMDTKNKDGVVQVKRKYFCVDCNDEDLDNDEDDNDGDNDED